MQATILDRYEDPNLELGDPVVNDDEESYCGMNEDKNLDGHDP